MSGTKTNRQKANKIADGFISERTKDLPANKIQRMIISDACVEMAEFKDKWYEDRIREILYESFYVHPHDHNHFCTDDFEYNGTEDSMDWFVEEFIKRLKNDNQQEREKTIK